MYFKVLVNYLFLFFISAGVSVYAVSDDCLADWDWDDSGLTVNFTDDSETDVGPIISHYWEFGDGITSDAINPVHTYDEAGEYMVCLTIETSDGCTHIFCDNINVADGSGGGTDCNAEFSIVSQEFIDGTWHVTFSNDSDGDIGSVIWTFDDGTSSEELNPVHIFEAGGEKAICLVITSSDGTCVDEQCETIMIGELDGDCEADWDWEDSGLTVEFTNDSESDAGSIETYSWDFGDGSSSDDENPTHVYPFGGEFEVCLTITTSEGCFSTFCDPVDIEGDGGVTSCAAFFEVTSIVAEGDGFSVDFSNLTEPATASPSVWNFGDGSEFLEVTDASHFFEAAGTYTVCLTVGTDGGDCFDQYCYDLVLGFEECIDVAMIDSSADCFDNYEPVCGCDGITYSNECYAKNYSGILFWTQGECSTTAIENANHNSIKLFPNPADEFLYVQFSSPNNSVIELRNLLGEIILSKHNKSSITVIETATVPNGHYIILINDTNHTNTHKLIIQH